MAFYEDTDKVVVLFQGEASGAVRVLQQQGCGSGHKREHQQWRLPGERHNGACWAYVVSPLPYDTEITDGTMWNWHHISIMYGAT